MKSSQKQTIYDIAKRAGASPSTVSSALNGTWKARRIREDTVKRIKAIAADLGYSVNLQARGLRKAKSGLVGMILPEHDNRFFSQLSQTFTVETRKRGLCPVIVSTRRDPNEEAKTVSNLISYAIESLIIVGASDPEALSHLCRGAGIVHVFVDQPCQSAPSVASDNHRGAEVLAETLMAHMPPQRPDRPRSWLYFLGGDATLYASSQRIGGFKAAVAARTSIVRPEQIIACGYEREPARQALEHLHNRLGGLPAGLLINSITSFEGVIAFLGALAERDIRDCVIGCYDYDPFGMLLRFPVHMIRQRTNKLIEEAYSHLDGGDDAPGLTLIEPVLVPAQPGPGATAPNDQSVPAQVER